ncbi:expressed unknown protein [Seminavis robusta]|uniref:Uncharacterized protein n=1 Tax=Seminavis robusta TaxID=568900 RepID=A0A9N8H3T1_9STRA|nr:expressed unknown protein [Seminavis robusta]|eukprot:Sro68_g038130.1 n/a (650) ;mRNA; r:69211-71160
MTKTATISNALSSPPSTTPAASFVRMRRWMRILGIGVCIYLAHPWGGQPQEQRQQQQQEEATVQVKTEEPVKTNPPTVSPVTPILPEETNNNQPKPPEEPVIPEPPPPAEVQNEPQQSNLRKSNPEEDTPKEDPANTVSSENTVDQPIQQQQQQDIRPQEVTTTNNNDNNNMQVNFHPNPALGEQQQTYVFPLDGSPDRMTKNRVMMAFPENKEQDAGWQAAFGEHMTPCPVTSLIRVYRSDLITLTESLWTLETLDSKRRPKAVGGDEYYITYTAEGHTEPTAIAYIHDWNNGNYSFHFVSSPTAPEQQNLQDLAERSTGTLTVVLEQSCGMGRLAPPLKQYWHTSGAINQVYKLDGIPAPKHIQRFQFPNQDRRINLGQYHQVVMMGDSMFGQFACGDPAPDDPPFKCRAFQSNVFRGKQIEAALQTETMTRPFFVRTHEDLLDANDIALKKVQQALVERSRLKGTMRKGELFPRDGRGQIMFSFNHLRTIQGLPEIIPTTNEIKEQLHIALVIGSGVWDILADDEGAGGQDFSSHLVACEQLILSIRETYPRVALYWKSMTAMHIHAVANEENGQDWIYIRRVYYMSNSRARHLDELQKALMKKLNVQVLDVFDATYYGAHKARTGDGRHYKADFNERMLSWFYTN